MTSYNRLPLALLFLRLSVFLVMMVWTVDKLLHPQHAAAVYKHFYMIGGLGDSIMMIIGAFEVVLLVGFVIGFQKKLTYGAVLVLHAISTLTSYKQYLAPFADKNLLFFAAWPMLAACYAVFILRDRDTLFTVKRY